MKNDELHVIDQKRGIAVTIKIHDYPARVRMDPIIRSKESGRPLYMYLGADA